MDWLLFSWMFCFAVGLVLGFAVGIAIGTSAVSS